MIQCVVLPEDYEEDEERVILFGEERSLSLSL